MEKYIQINVECHFELLYPFPTSLEKVHQLARLQKMKVLSSNTHSPLAKVSMSTEKFKSIFGENPRIKEYKPPTGTESFLASVKVLLVRPTK